MRRSSIGCNRAPGPGRVWAAAAALALSLPGHAQAAPAGTAAPLVVLVPGGPDDCWARVFRDGWPTAHGPVSIRHAGRPEGAVAEALLSAAVRGDLPDLALVVPSVVPRLAAAGLLSNLAANEPLAAARLAWAPGVAAAVAPDAANWWGVPAGLSVPLLLARDGWGVEGQPPTTWAEFLEALEGQPPRGSVQLDPGNFADTVDALRRRAGVRADGIRTGTDGPWAEVLALLAALHEAPSASRFWEKRWAPGTATFRRGRAVFAIGSTETLRGSTGAASTMRAARLPPVGIPGARYPARVPALWIVPAGRDLARIAAVLTELTGGALSAGLADHCGWAPARADGWGPVGSFLERPAAWRTVRDILGSELDVERDGETEEGRRVAYARAAGLWLGGMHPEATDAWQLAQSPAGRNDPAPPLPKALPRFPASESGDPTPWEPVERTLAQGETTLLPLPLAARGCPDGPEGPALQAVRAGAEFTWPAAVFALARTSDALLRFGIAGAPDSESGQFIRVTVPPKTPPGRYRVRLVCANAERTRLPLETVRVTSAPERLAPIPALCGVGLDSDAPRWGAVADLLLDHGLTPFPLSLTRHGNREAHRGPIVLRRWHDPSRAAEDARAARSAGARDAVLEYSYDEPTLLHFPHLHREAPVYRRLGLRVLVTHPPDPALAGVAQVWGVHTGLRPTDTPSGIGAWRQTLRRMARARARGEAIWWYTAGDVAPLPNLQLGANLTRLRAAFYRLPALGFGGVLQAEAAAWATNPSILSPGPLGVGEGILCFPDAANPARVHPSLRLDALRDGVYTVRLLETLRTLLAKRAAELPDAAAWADYADERIAAYGRRVVQPEALALGAAVHPFLHLTEDPVRLAGAGRALRLEVEAARTGPLLLVRGEPADWSVTTADRLRLQGRVDAGARLTIAGRAVPVSRDGEFRAAIALAPGRNASELRVEAGTATRKMTWWIQRVQPPLSPG